MQRYDIAILILLVTFFTAAKRTRKTLKPLRSGSVPQTKEIDAFGKAASFLVVSVYMIICWLISHHVNIWLLVIIEVVCYFTYSKRAWWFVRVDKKKESE